MCVLVTPVIGITVFPRPLIPPAAMAPDAVQAQHVRESARKHVALPSPTAIVTMLAVMVTISTMVATVALMPLLLGRGRWWLFELTLTTLTDVLGLSCTFALSNTLNVARRHCDQLLRILLIKCRPRLCQQLLVNDLAASDNIKVFVTCKGCGVAGAHTGTRRMCVRAHHVLHALPTPSGTSHHRFVPTEGGASLRLTGLCTRRHNQTDQRHGRATHTYKQATGRHENVPSQPCMAGSR